MPEIGQSLSHYSLVGKIGKGGMGEVYRAKDQKLGRDVAIKILPEEFARDADRVARFQRCADSACRNPATSEETADDTPMACGPFSGGHPNGSHCMEMEAGRTA